MNYIGLIKKICQYGLGAFLNDYGITIEKFLELICSEDGFTVEQINKICNILTIKSPEEINEIFFTNMLRKTQHKTN